MSQALPPTPALTGVHPVLPPEADPVAVAVSEALAHWPAVHEALKAARVADANELAAAITSTTDVGTGE